MTLQDVEVLWGSLINGSPVNSPSWIFSKAQWIDMIERLLGVLVTVGDLSRQKVMKRLS